MSRPVKITCHYCGAKVLPITQDHIVPRGLGGPDKMWNIVPACVDCNRAKADKWPTCDCARCKFARCKFARLRAKGV